jgi:hypothetical protein
LPHPRFGVNLGTTKAVLNGLSDRHSSGGESEVPLVSRGRFGDGIGRSWWYQAIIVDDVGSNARFDGSKCTFVSDLPAASKNNKKSFRQCIKNAISDALTKAFGE